MACELSDQLRVHLREGIRLRHPEYSQAEITLALIRLTAGEELFRRVAPDATVVP